MLIKLANAGIRRPRRSGLLALLLLIVAAGVGGLAPQVLKARNDFENRSSESAGARTQLERATHQQPTPGVLALVNGPPRGAAAIAAARTLERDPAVAHVITPASARDRRLVSRDGRSTLIAAVLRADAQPQDSVDRIANAFKGNHKVLLGGSAVAQRQVDKQASEDLGVAEILVFPLLTLLAFL